MVRLFISLLLLFISSFASKVFASMEEYCSVPPFAVTRVKPNVVFLMDFSGSMQFPAYYKCYAQGNYISKVVECRKYENGYYETYDVIYNPNKEYYGYFKSDKYYVYDNNSRVWKESNSCHSSVPPSWEKIGYSDCFSGNFLNFLIMTRIDAALKAMIGGKATCSDSNCILMPQGSNRDINVKFYNKSGSCRFFLHPEDYVFGDYVSKHMLIEALWDEHSSCPFNSWSGTRRADVLVDVSLRRGVVQDNFDKVDMSFMVFSYGFRWKYRRYGEIRYSFFENDLELLVNLIQTEVPHGGTPTGEAMWEVEDFLKQENDHYYESNEGYIEKGTEKDPYYVEVNGVLYPLPCRKSYVVLISDGEWNGWIDPVRPAYHMHVNDLRNDIEGNQTAQVFTLFTFSDSNTGKNSMETVAAFGSFKDFEGKEECRPDWPYPFKTFPDSSLNESWPVDECNPDSSYNDCCLEWDSDRDGHPDNFFAASNGKDLENGLRKVFEKILSPTSGTSVGSLSQKNMRGAVVCQNVFFPYQNIADYKVSWIGYIYTWWFLNTKKVQNIREDTNQNAVLDVTEDYIISWIYQDGKLSIDKYLSNSAGEPTEKVGTYDSFSELRPIFEVGNNLVYVSPGDRVIYTETDNNSDADRLISFNVSNLSNFEEFLGSELPSCLSSKQSLVEYILGKDVEGCRKRVVDEEGHTWKLGDITYSSPVIVKYDKFSVIFVGANDGMLHAFRLGYFRRNADSQHPVELTNNGDDNGKELLGEELWAFIPRNTMPYLRYLADKNYCHIYFVDLTPYVIDVNIDGKKQKILIGGMRFGGATGSNDPTAVKPPEDTCSSDSNCVGRSSYFALNVTDPEHPKFMWEFTSSDLGFSYSGPGIIREGDRYYVVFASGPINYKADYSDNADTLKIFIVDLKSGDLVRTIDTGIRNAFSGRIFKEGVDLNADGNTDFLIFGFSKKENAEETFKGGLLLLAGTNSTLSDLIPLGEDVNKWTVVEVNSFNIGNSEEVEIQPVTSKVSFMKCFGKWYMYFGTGRWFYKYDDKETDRNLLFGIPLIKNLNGHYSLPKKVVNVTQARDSETVCSDARNGKIDGWFIKLNRSDLSKGYLKEKDISDPTLTKDNVIIFTTVQPNGEPCELGGRSRLWALNCATGGSIVEECDVYQVSKLYGTVLLQLSGADINEIRLKYDRSAGQSNISNILIKKGNRATNWFTGIAPESAPPFVYPSGSLVGTLLLWLEM